MEKIIVDFDSTIVDSIKAYCDTYNSLFEGKKGFRVANHEKVRSWGLEDECPLAKDMIETIFAHPSFFKVLEPYPNAKRVLEKLSKGREVIICSIGTYKNLSLKSRWIEKHLPFIDKAILLNTGGIGGLNMDKSVVNMDNAVFIDDRQSNLDSSNARHKILYGKEYDWNKDWKGMKVNNWKELEELYLFNDKLLNIT